jgi:hypothetical protein
MVTNAMSFLASLAFAKFGSVFMDAYQRVLIR